MIEEFASLLGIRSSYIHTIRRKDNIIVKAFCMADDEDANLSVHLLQFLFTLMKSPTRHYLPYLHPLSTSHLLIDRQHPCKNLPSLLKHDQLLLQHHYLMNFLHLFPHPRFKLTPLLFKILNYSPLQNDLRTPALHSNNLQDLPPATPNYDPTPLAQDDLYTIATPTPTDNLYTPTPSAKLLRFKARSLLVKGNMPLFPSAKRDWVTVEEESVVLLPNLLLPPKNWRRLTLDQRLLAVEFASMSLTQGERHSSLLLPERSFLIHSFHFLVLPGSAGFSLDNKAKARIYTYQSLLSIPLSKNSSTLLDKINNIPVRI
ncbi:hypothetical protein DPMN_053832 [Dreissena polymorpha]|uniref:Uncharacterized protein n=1 Tax=Dreissena polymorpha TaxID=45954 RepID=A0A9D4HR19_DREPO|nr:hypothetical protein DPMN_053832 [Dreissena polymorpha]